MTEATAMTRADRLAGLLEERGLDCLLVTDLVNVRYLTGFTGSNGACIIGPDTRLFLTDFRYVSQAEEQVHGFERVRAERDMVADLARRLQGRAGFDDDHVTVKAHAKLSEQSEAELVAAGGLVERLREVKEEDELRAIAEAARLADEVFELVAERGLVDHTEREVALFAEQAMRERGAEDPSFPAIVAAGPQGALPHAVPRDAEIPAGALVVIDMGARLDGYCSDCTRTLATGALDGAARAVYDLVLSAQETALEAVRPGADRKGLDSLAREIIETGGHGENFGHGLGHGVGLEVHEEPRLSQATEGELRAGNVVTVEPGVYLPDELGVRIEDLVVVTDEGHEVLTHFPKTLVTTD